MRMIALGVLAALFFSSTFILNRAMHLEGGHWVWSASLRYAWMLLLLSGGLLIWRPALLWETLRLFGRCWRFWVLAGSIGFGAFYALITFSASYTPGWVVAATWQTTILATPFVLWAFGRRVPLRALFLTGLVFAGVILVNVEQGEVQPWREILLGAVPVLLAAVAYPTGNQLVWEASQEREGPRRWWSPAIASPVMDNTFCRVLLLTLGSMPLWIVLLCVTSPPSPGTEQVLQTVLVAVCSGVVATSLFLYARHQATSAGGLAAVDCTQSMEVLFSLAGEAVFLGGVLPGLLGWSGLGLTILGLMLYLRVQHVR